MTDPILEERFELEEEPVFARDFEGRLIRVDRATEKDYEQPVTVEFKDAAGESLFVTVPKAVPSTDAQGNIRRDLEGRTIPRATTIYDAAGGLFAADLGSVNPIPILCHQEHMTPVGVCRVCVVNIQRRQRDGTLKPSRKLLPACQHRVEDGMVVHTIESGTKEGKAVQASVTLLTELLLARNAHDKQPQDGRYRNELRALTGRLGIAEPRFERREHSPDKVDDTSPVILVDHNNCILCNRCVRACNDVKPFHIVGRTGKGPRAKIGFDLDDAMGESGCVACGECMISCPTGALTFRRPVNPNPWKGDRVPPGVVPAEELAELPLFCGVPFSFLKWNEGSVARRRLRPGDVLCREGDYGASAFVLEEGDFEIVQGGSVVSVRTPADVILGEMACMSHQPRTATIRARSAASVLDVRKNVLYVLQRNKVAREMLDRVYRERALADHLRKGRLFRGLTEEQSKRCLAFLKGGRDLEFVLVDPDEVVCREGERARDFFVIRLGFVKVQRTLNGREVALAQLGPGEHFGEIAMLSGLSERVARELPAGRLPGERTATCTALDHVELVRIAAATFADLLGAEPDIRDHLEARCIELLTKNRELEPDAAPLLDRFLDQGLFEGQKLLVIDLNTCVRCDDCVRGCVAAHEDGHNRLLRDGLRYGHHLIATACRSCHDPRCLVGCPVDAIHRRPGGLSIVIEDHCIGCGLCAYNCPFGNISIVERRTGGKDASDRLAVTCDLCESLPGQPGPTCVRACPHGCLVRPDAVEFRRMTSGAK
jgi:Fe-S-cluster-containing hydrogenase component 2/CRP-like cAMP-binding protein